MRPRIVSQNDVKVGETEVVMVKGPRVGDFYTREGLIIKHTISQKEV